MNDINRTNFIETLDGVIINLNSIVCITPAGSTNFIYLDGKKSPIEVNKSEYDVIRESLKKRANSFIVISDWEV